LIIKF